MATTLSCFNCGNQLNFADFVPFKDTCEKCNYDVHCCKNCQHFDPNSYNSCKEPQADRVLEKERANFCDYFRAGGSANTKAQSSSKGIAVNKLEDLFKKS